MVYAVSPDHLHKAWQDYVNNQLIAPGIQHYVRDSWLRCTNHLDPLQSIRLKTLSSDHFLATQVANFNLISVGRPVMEDIYQFIGGTNSIVVLVNNAGYLLEMLGDAEMVAQAKHLGIKPGCALSEALAGTNAFALALIERIPIQVTGYEHFLKQFHGLSEAAAPIFDITGRPLGAMGVVSPAANSHPHTLGLTAAGAQAVMGQIQSDYLLNEQNSQLADINAILAAISEGIVVWNAKGLVMHINKAAAKIIGIQPETYVGHNIFDLLKYPAYIQSAIEKLEPITDVEASIRFGERDINIMLSLRFVVNGSQQIQSVIFSFRQEKEIYRLVQNQMGAQAFFSLNDIAGPSVEIQRVRRMVTTASAAKASVLIRGESGTGKNMVASAIHNESQRKDGPFLIFACSALPNEFILRELEGIEEGISEKRPGGRPSKFELAHGGTLFFQDVDVLSLEAQSSLLNVIELGIVQRLGSSRPISVDVRIIGSTSAHIEELIARGNFRADLFYRLSLFEINLPPLRERRKDIPVLTERILNRLSRQLNRPLSLAAGVNEILMNYQWPGNLDELEAVLGQTAIQAGVSELIGPMHLPDYVLHPNRLPIGSQHVEGTNSLDEIERDAFINAARICSGNVSQMAKVLEIGRTTVWRKLHKYNISVDDYRDQHDPQGA